MTPSGRQGHHLSGGLRPDVVDTQKDKRQRTPRKCCNAATGLGRWDQHVRLSAIRFQDGELKFKI